MNHDYLVSTGQMLRDDVQKAIRGLMGGWHVASWYTGWNVYGTLEEDISRFITLYTGFTNLALFLNSGFLPDVPVLPAGEGDIWVNPHSNHTQDETFIIDDEEFDNGVPGTDSISFGSTFKGTGSKETDFVFDSASSLGTGSLTEQTSSPLVMRQENDIGSPPGSIPTGWNYIDEPDKDESTSLFIQNPPGKKYVQYLDSIKQMIQHVYLPGLDSLGFGKPVIPGYHIPSTLSPSNTEEDSFLPEEGECTTGISAGFLDGEGQQNNKRSSETGQEEGLHGVTLHDEPQKDRTEQDKDGHGISGDDKVEQEIMDFLSGTQSYISSTKENGENTEPEIQAEKSTGSGEEYISFAGLADFARVVMEKQEKNNNGRDERSSVGKNNREKEAGTVIHKQGLSIIDTDSILEALTRQIEKEYRRLYGRD